MEKTNYARRLDSTGRLSIPIKLREELNLKEGDVFDFYTHLMDGKFYLCIECKPDEHELDTAIKTIERYGLKVQIEG